MEKLDWMPCAVTSVTSLESNDCDGIVLVAGSVDSLTDPGFQFLKAALEDLLKVDASVGKQVVLVPLPGHPLSRAVFSPTGPVNRDYDDYRRFGDAAGTGIKRAIAAGMQNPLLIVIPTPQYPNALIVAALGALQVLYVPYEIREDVPLKTQKVKSLGIFSKDPNVAPSILQQVQGIESGRVVCRDIGGSDPERMAAPNVAQYIQRVFGSSSSVKVNVIKGNVEEYPLFSAVDRCASLVERHRGRIIKLEYTGEGEITKTLMLVGKGVTYDTGGADIKAGGVMAGMHRDKCGAATVAGIFRTLDLLKPQGIKVVGTMAMVRNSVGVESYVSDEIITSRAGVRVRVGNTDAEGRMAMADCLCEMKEKACNEINPHIMTIATLTGHAIRAMGPNYSIIMDNGPARNLDHANKVQQAGHKIGDPFEISTIRREDYEFHTGKSEYEDVLQANNKPSTMTPRGHQSPAAFMIMASGLDKYGVDSDKPIPYTHIDIAGSSGPFPGVPTGAPIPALTAFHML